MNNKSGDVPHHYKHTEATAEQEHAYIIDLTQVFWSKKQRLCTKMGSEIACNGKQEYQPKHKKQLVPAEMQEQ
jgi:hypothetical protein